MTYDHNYCLCCNKSPCECNIPKLLPCPFCNGTNVGVWDEGFGVYQAGCEDCDIPGPPADSKIEAAERWNNRPSRDRLLTKIEHLEFEKDRLYDRAMEAEQMLFDQYSGRLSQEDVFTYVREQLEKI